MKVEKMPGGVRDTGGVLFPGVRDTGGVLFPGVSDTVEQFTILKKP